MLKTILIDDESKALETIEEMVKIHCPQAQIVAKANSVATGREAIEKYQPDVVLLDIQMRDGSGFDLLNQLNHIDFHLIFITAYEEYALQAFKFSAIDYILKPIDPDDITRAFDKLDTSLHQSINARIETLFNNLDAKLNKEKKIVLKTFQKTDIVKISDIIRCESHRGYTEFHMKGQAKIMVSKTLNTYYELLKEFDFFKVHKSHFINLHYLKRLERKSPLMAVMADDSSVPVSVRKKEALVQYLESNFDLLGIINVARK